MRSCTSFQAVWLIAALIAGLPVLAVHADDPSERDIDYDCMLFSVENLLSEELWFEYSLAGVDNDGNGILEEDTLALLSSVLRGTHRVASLDPAMVAAIQADFAENRLRVDEDLAAEGVNCDLLQAFGYPCKLTELLALPDLELPPEVAENAGHALLDFVGGLVTAGDTPATFDFINGFIDELIDSLSPLWPPLIPQELIDLLKQDFHLEPEIYDRWGDNGNQPNRLGPNGDVDDDGVTNYDEYDIAGGDREVWLTECDIIPPIHVIVDPSSEDHYRGEEFSLTVTIAGGEAPFSFLWERAGNPLAVLPITDGDGFEGSTTDTLDFWYPMGRHNGMDPWVRISDPVTVYNPPEPGSPPGAIERDGFGGRTSRPAYFFIWYREFAIRYQPQGGHRRAGESFSTTFTVWGGSSLPTYQWYEETRGAVADQTTKRLTFDELQSWDEGTYYCIATGNEGSLVGDTIALTVNAPPEALDPYVTPTSPATGDELVANFTYHDIEADPRADRKFRWYVDGEYQGAFDDRKRITRRTTAKGEAWQFRARVFDGEQWGPWSELSPAVVIVNTPPEARDPYVTPASPATGDQLTANFTYRDRDGDAKAGRKFGWYEKAVRQTAFDDRKRLPPSATAAGERWRFQARVYDGEQWGVWSPLSDPVTIGSKASGTR